jgi:hypothetical protein
MVKPGYRTSEFWFTMVSFIFSGLYLMGIIGENSQKEDLIQETSKGLEATILIIGQLTILFKYIKGRTDLKKTWWSTATPEERKAANRANRKNKKKKTVKKKPTIEITDQSLT